MDAADPLPDDVERELDRIRTRWAVLPLARAQEASALVAPLVTELGERSARALGHPVPGPTGLPPGVLVDALAVVVRDALLAGVGDDVAERLVQVRRSLP